MTNAETLLITLLNQAIESLYNVPKEPISLQKTRKEFEGDFTFVTFGLSKLAKKSPELIGQELASFSLNLIKKLVFTTLLKDF